MSLAAGAAALTPPLQTRSDSGFVLLTTQTSPTALSSPHRSTHLPLPRPRFLPLLQLTAILDFAVTLWLGLRVGLARLPVSAVVLNSARPVAVVAVASSRNVREYGPVIIGQVMVSALVLLFRLNEVVQTSNTIASPKLPATRNYAETATSPTFFHRLFNPVTVWYLSSFAFSLLHYALFVIFVGIRRRRNPLAGRMRRSSTWGEQRWEGREESVAAGSEAGESRGSERERLLSAEEEDLETAYGEASGGDDSSELGASSDDEDDIIDVPKRGGELRNRASRASLLSARNAGGNAAEVRARVASGPGLRASRNYGSINSLAGI
ncbi:hypothetical protein NBRC10512_004795 [Rhodotorula toruloides]|uniref:RHTO0S03e04478g1_1 n=2 Tax=Rhodotorula toruloides TaxID=5286 RepID=A0A061ATT6_RHOTO|nr:uncharacterized protein RHTO_00232 [Rhodotorula toruloides NP11]EMS25804.1 hypothetical protein RHTO_00232 [Rhodotorula toruloides NP11]CDR38142.1 RHTO0S03e04478g1_1 [Rhodotorula toruloides]